MKPLRATVEIGRVAELINGDRGKNYPSQSHRVAKGIPFINAGHLAGGLVRLDSMNYVTEERFKMLRGGRVQRDDILLCIRGTLGRVAIATEEVVPAAIASSLLIIRPGPNLVPRFLLAVLSSPWGQQTISSHDNGAAQPNVGARDVARFEIPFPPITTQQKIAAILSTYDDLIENNSRRIKLLEEMAQRIYREWFTEFRYPGHDGVPLVNSELGPIPSDWEIAPVGKVTRVLGGGTPSKGIVAYWEPGTVVWFTPTDLTTASAMFMSESRLMISKEGLTKSSATLFPPGSVMMTSRATIGVVSITTVPAATNQGFITCLVTDVVGTYHLYFWLIDHRDVITSLASGATFKEINKATFRNIPYLKAARRVERDFEKRIDPIASQVTNLLNSQRTLRKSRDLLLPRLVSGEIDVSDLDIATASLVA